MRDLQDFFNKKVKVTDIDNNIYIGIVDVYTQPNDNDNGEAAIALSTGIWLDENEIKIIEVV